VARTYLLYDDGCEVCTVTKDLVVRLDSGREIEYLGLRTQDARQLAADLDEWTYWSSFHVVSADGTIASSGEAVTKLLTLLPVLRPVGKAIQALPRGQAAAQAFYDLALRVRGGLQCQHERARLADGPR